MRGLLGAMAAVLIGLALFELTMQPSGSERFELAFIFIVMAAVSGLSAVFLPVLAGRSRKLIVTLLSLSLVSVGIAVVGLVVAASRMFFSDHDLALLLVVLGFGLLASLGFAASASSALTGDLRKMAATAHDVAEGNFEARTEVSRRDEVGELARDLDVMAERLEEAARATAAEDARRRSFFAAVGHDLRTPLASMRAAVEALRDGVAPDPDRYYRSMEQDLVALNSLVDDLFLLSRIEAGDVPVEASPTDINDVVDEAIEVLTPVANAKGVDVVLVSGPRVVVETAPEAVGRVIRNLLDNAIRHAPSNSRVEVTVARDRGVRVVVRDEGAGFSEAFIDGAFESFARSDSARSRATGGAGLGLAIARGFVESLGGEIWAEPGPGGLVAFRIPAAPGRSS